LLSLVMANICDCAVVDQHTAVPITNAIAVFCRKSKIFFDVATCDRKNAVELLGIFVIIVHPRQHICFCCCGDYSGHTRPLYCTKFKIDIENVFKSYTLV